MGAYLERLATGQDPNGAFQQPVVVYQQNVDPQNCAQDCTIPSVGNGTPIRTALTPSCKIKFGPFTNPSTATTNLNVLFGLTAFDDSEVTALINAGFIPTVEDGGAYVNSLSPTTKALAQLHAFEKFSSFIPYIMTNVLVTANGVNVDNQFGIDLTSVHINPGDFSACSVPVPGPTCTPCNGNGTNNVSLYSSCAIFISAQDGLIVPVVPGVSVTIQFCVEAFADARDYYQCAPSGAVAARRV